jgi:hypothetical protein
MLGVDSRLSSGVLIVGGVRMSEIISSSTEKTLTNLRNERMKAYGLSSIEDYRHALEQQIQIEPFNFVEIAKPKKILSFVALKDVTVPTKNQEILYRTLGSQALVTHDSDHFRTILHVGFNEKRRIIKFFSETLETPPAGSKPAPPVKDGTKLCLNRR